MLAPSKDDFATDLLYIVTRAMRRDRITQCELADAAGVSRVCLNRFLRGKAMLTLSSIEAVLAVLNMKLAILTVDMSIDTSTLCDRRKRNQSRSDTHGVPGPLPLDGRIRPRTAAE